MKYRNSYFFCCYLIFGWILIPSAFAQPNMERLLNNVDNPSSWTSTPVSTPIVPQPVQNYSNPGVQNYPVAQPNSAQFNRQKFSQMLKDSARTANGTGNNKSDWSSSTAYSDWQEAENQASRARDAEQRARYDKDKWRRGDDASEAYYAANAARNASDKVYQASVNGDPTGKQYADRARAAADRARADSDQARYYADSGN